MQKLWLLDSNYCQNSKAQGKSLRTFLKLLDIITGYLLFFVYLFVYLFIFSVSKFLLRTVNKNLLYFKSFNIPLNCKSSRPEVSSCRRKFHQRGCSLKSWDFWGAYLCVGVILINLPSGFVEMALLHCCSPVGLLHFCRASSKQR